MTQLTAQFENIQHSANEASEMMEGEQLEKRELEEKLAETMVSVSVQYPAASLEQLVTIILVEE